jgi:hypothetical protein
MKKNKSKLLLPVVIIIVVILVLGGVLLRDTILELFKPAKSYVKVEGYPREVESTKKTEKIRVVVKSEQDFKNLMKQLFDDENKLPTPEVDFNKSDLFVATTDLNDTKGVRLIVREMNFIPEDNKYKIYLERQLPGSTCVNEAISNIALDIVEIEKNLPEVDSSRVDKYIDCKPNN